MKKISTKNKTGFNECITSFFDAELYDNLSEFINSISNRVDNVEFIKKYKTRGRFVSQRTGKKAEAFSKTVDYAAAKRLLINGYPEVAETIKNGIIEFDPQKRLNKVLYKPQGSSPSVGRFLSGNPNCMRKSMPKLLPQKNIRVFCNSTFGYNLSADAIIKHGISILNVVSNLEAQGFRVELHTLFMAYTQQSTVNGQMQRKIVCDVKLKSFTEAINIAKCGYFLVHPSWSRRHLFRWIETFEPANHKSFTNSYGSAILSFNSFFRETIKHIIGKDDLYIDTLITDFGEKKPQEIIERASKVTKSL